MATPKSILKKPAVSPVQVPANVGIPPPKTDAEARHLQTALDHAHRIQAQKRMALEILENIEALSLLPDGAEPTPAEAERFKRGVTYFQPSDYTALIEERNVNGFCGYALCGKPPAAARKTREWLRPEGERRFCSEACARNAMYVRAQLDETPAWERRGGIGMDISLKDELVAARAQDQSPALTGLNDLAHERGEAAGSQKAALVTDQIVEKTPTRAKVTFNMDDFAHDSIEGFKVSSTKHLKKNDTPEQTA